jgi:hypothetical protein
MDRMTAPEAATEGLAARLQELEEGLAAAVALAPR